MVARPKPAAVRPLARRGVRIADGESGERGKALIAGLIPAKTGYEDMGKAIENHAVPSATSCTFSSVPVNVHDVHIAIGGNFYEGSGDTVLAVYDPSLGFVTGGGVIMHTAVWAFDFNAKYLKSGQIQGSLLYIEHRPTGDVILKSNAMGSLSIVGNTAYILGKATLNAVGNYKFRATVVDNGEPGSIDQFGLQVKDPSNIIVSDLTFSPITLTGGNIQVPHR